MKKKVRTKPVKLIELLRTLDRKEFNAFGRYVKAMVKDENVHKLFLELKKYAPAFVVGQKEREKIFKKIFGKEEYNNRQLNYLTSAMNLHLEEYLILVAVRNNEKQRNYMLMEYFKERKQYEFFKRTADAIMDKENDRPVKDGDYYLTNMKIEYDLYHYSENDSKRIERQAGRIGSLVNSLDEFYMYYKLNMASDLRAFGEGFNVNQEIYLFVDNIKEAILNHPLYKNTLIQIYLFIINNFQEHTYENFCILKDKVLKVIDNLNENHQKSLYICLANFAIICNRKGIPNIKSDLFYIQKMGIDKNYAVNNGELQFQNFLNAINVATSVSINEIEWAKTIVETKSYLLRKDVREDSIFLAKGFIAYAEEEFGEALMNINQIQQWRNPAFGLQGRLVMLKCYYELDIDTKGNYLEVTEHFVDTYKNFMKRSKLFSPQIIRGVTNLNTFTLQIMRNRYKKRYTEEEMLERMKKYEPMVAKAWVFEKVQTHLKRVSRKKKTA